ncbi:hypothetical protein C9795_01530 [Listeria monocytogenes]|uniref:hypothetical protein n=1 Tax=Listeria monocytogenes TaxID=1639 RepID=UPI000D72C20F|nr:hypothetical protein [Listeria monocytogenes]EHC5243894.1 hypothetical protein [Listeria monocytogenes serotype 1/2a]ELU5616849.1 hypothetical protein [Listeria monocytogenes]PXE69938.1 hypothetical protein C9795_01530 [Listeria monocytogenes]PXE76063.1 hypothetical protein C9796_01520 [Listeria monocytogenes]HAO5809295.1 hypothetical protein [Listeria monocytogenes]
MTAKAYKIAGGVFLVFSLWLNWHTYTQNNSLEKELKTEEQQTQKWKKAYEDEKHAKKIAEKNEGETVETQEKKDVAYQQNHVMEEQLSWNKEALHALFSYHNLAEREENLSYYLTEEQKKKMELAKSDSDNADGSASLQTQSSFYQSINEDSFSTWNVVEVEMEAEGVKTPVSLLANLTFSSEEGKWLLNDMKFQENN